MSRLGEPYLYECIQMISNGGNADSPAAGGAGCHRDKLKKDSFVAEPRLQEASTLYSLQHLLVASIYLPTQSLTLL